METTELPLRDIHLPPEIGWWPPAPGWWLLAALIPLILWLSYWLYRRITKKTAIKVAKKQLQQLRENQQLDNNQKLTQVSALIRRVAISNIGRQEAAGLTGQQWLNFLDQGITGAPFSKGIGSMLSEMVYRRFQPSQEEMGQLFKLCQDWLKQQGKKRS